MFVAGGVWMVWWEMGALGGAVQSEREDLNFTELMSTVFLKPGVT
jgi:hypothetical protein